MWKTSLFEQLHLHFGYLFPVANATVGVWLFMDFTEAKTKSSPCETMYHMINVEDRTKGLVEPISVLQEVYEWSAPTIFYRDKDRLGELHQQAVCIGTHRFEGYIQLSLIDF